MASQVLYRKWRPQTLAEIVGQGPITQTLSNALSIERIAHAYLFCGPRGTGKTSTGRILAKAVNCLSEEPEKPCNTCTMCQAINEGRALDLMEIDGASNRGIDEIRDLREKINFAPTSAKYKVYIIDEVHMLTEPAFNALLKTLEEPPPHAIFILATTEVHKVPLTILSRCQRFDFRRITKQDIVNKLQAICEQEGVHAEPQALDLIAKAATGSLRDAENLLEQVILHYGLDFSLAQVSEKLGFSSDSRISELITHVLSKDVPAGLATINSISADGIDLRQFNQGVVEYLRGLLMVKAGAEKNIDFPDDVLSEMKTLVSGASLDDISNAIKLFAQIDFRTDPQSTLPLEIALVDCSLSEAQQPHRTVSKRVVLPKEEIAPLTVTDTDQPHVEKPDEIQVPSHIETEPGEEAAPIEPAKAAVLEKPQNVDYIRQNWSNFINACRGVGSSGNLDALLRSSCEAVALDGDTLTLGFYADFHKTKIENPKYRHLVEMKLQDVFGVPYHVRCVMVSKKNKDVKEQKQTYHPLVNEAVKMGGRIIDEE